MVRTSIEDLAFWGLPDDPLSELDDPEDVWMPSHFQRAERALQDAVAKRQILAVVGPPGAGKSTLLRRFIARSRRQARVKLLSVLSLDRRRVASATLATAILRDLTGQKVDHLAPEARAELLQTSLASADAEGHWPVLLLDEAHHLKTDGLLAIKHIWDSHQLFRRLGVILVGQEPLAATLENDPAVRELGARTRVLRLPAMTAEHARDYCDWRWSRVKGGKPPVAVDAWEALARRGGEPLGVNNVLGAALNYTQSVGDRVVTSAHVGRI